MSWAALTVKVRQAVNLIRKEGEEVRYKRCSQAQPVRLMVKRKETVDNITVQEVIENSDKAERLEEPLETVEANNGKMKALVYLESFGIKKMREFYAVIDEGERKG